jgi:hypothetical protein
VEQFGLTHTQVGFGSISRTRLTTPTKRPTTFYDSNRGLSWGDSLQSKGRKHAWIRQAIEINTIESYRFTAQSDIAQK